ncbi:MAG: DUF362 domain-containing protein [Candidatus Brocadiaceae bacterium]|nr:DUF362 domain-containing protein [Candidatus Brocadiaceae bacterium]
MGSTVWFAPFEDGADEGTVCRRTREVFAAAGLGAVVPEGAITAVKTHFGERGNDSFVSPACVRVVVEEVKRACGRPCLVETSTLYRGQRHNAVDHFNLAVEHGFGPEAMGCPLIFLDGLRGNLHVERPVNLRHCETVAVAGDFTLIPAAIIVSHFTGHVLSGIGGAIKNVAMGLASRAGKLRQHSQGRPEVQAADCIACGTCAQWCPEDAIMVGQAAHIDEGRCIGCGECVSVCPVGAIDFDWNAPAATFNEKMAEYAYGILGDKRDHVGFVTFLHRVTRHCNCMGTKGEKVCPDLGVLASTDPVAIDQAAVDLINGAAGRDLLEEVWPGAQYTAQFAHGEAIGLGSRRYALERV